MARGRRDSVLERQCRGRVARWAGRSQVEVHASDIGEIARTGLGSNEVWHDALAVTALPKSPLGEAVNRHCQTMRKQMLNVGSYIRRHNHRRTSAVEKTRSKCFRIDAGN